MGKDRETVPKQEPSHTSLIKLCEIGQRASLRNLLHKDSQQAAKEQKHLLLKAIENRHEELVTLLLEHGANPNVKDAIGDTPLHVALKTGQNEIAATILRYNADVNAHSRQGLTPLHYAAHQRDHDLVKKLVLKGADVNLENSEGRTPLMVVCRTGCVPLAKLLLQNGSDISKTDRLGWKALDYAIIGGIYGELKSLIPDQVPEINEKDFCRTCNKREPLSPTESVDSLFNREPGISHLPSNLETYATRSHNSSSLDRGHTSIKPPVRPFADDIKEIMENKTGRPGREFQQKEQAVQQHAIEEPIDYVPPFKECGCPLTVECSCAPISSKKSKHSPSHRYRNAPFPSLQTLHTKDTSVSESPTNSNTNLSLEDGSMEYIPPTPAYPASSKISFTTDKLDAIAKLVTEEKNAKLKAKDNVQDLEEANENLFRVKNDLEQALHSAQKSLAERERRIEDTDDHLHQLEDRLAREMNQKEKDLDALKSTREDARRKDDECERLRDEKDNLEKKYKELEKKLGDEKGGTQKMKNDISTMNGELTKAKDDANSKNKMLNNLINDLNKTVLPGSNTNLLQLPRSSTSPPSLDNQIANTIQNTKDKIKNLNKKLEDQGKENEKLRNDNATLKDVIEDMKADQAKKDQDRQQKLDHAKKNKHGLEDQIGALKKQVKEASEDAEKAKNLAESLPALKAEKDNAVQELKSEQRNVKGLERRIKDLEAENSRLRCEVARLRDCLRVTRRQQEKAETKVHELHNELQIGRATLEQCRLTPSSSRTGSTDFSNE